MRRVIWLMLMVVWCGTAVAADEAPQPQPEQAAVAPQPQQVVMIVPEPVQYPQPVWVWRRGLFAWRVRPAIMLQEPPAPPSRRVIRAWRPF